EACPRNVVGEVPGSGPLADQVVLVGAHLDSWHLAEGAMDNGSGAVTILEAARVLARVGPRPRRTIRFVWFMGEEHGLFGSEAYVKAHEEELDRIVAVINVDMAGEPRKFVTHGHPEVVSFLQAVVRDLPGYALESDVASNMHTYSDHAAFMKQGVCALAISGELGPGARFYHTPGDKYDTVDRRGVNGHAALVAVLARRLADADPMPAVRMDPAALAAEHGW
ncbi:MAG: Zn-dependent exopeptidase M28, partial [Phycisphaerae bacterium]|nr:Zn-dependent exopeptidase M28 [Phycisphaerae bacterium]